MVYNWQIKWELKSLSKNELFNIIIKAIVKQIEGLPIERVSLQGNFVYDYNADSLDIIATILTLEEVFEKNMTTKIPTTELDGVVIVEDILSLIYNILIDIEKHMDPFKPIKPDYSKIV